MTEEFSRWLRSHVPDEVRPALRSARRALKKMYYAPVDALHAIRHKDDLIPPPSLMFVGDGDFRKTGEEFTAHFITLGGLKPDYRVLDIGCGVGRMAVPLASYLSSKGEYRGFDIVPSGIDWCSRNITPRYPRFRFQVADIYNKGYNPGGKHLASEFRFPFDDASFDFAFATSVFTHLVKADAENYLAQTARVLRPGGTCLLTFFLLNDDSRRRMDEGASRLTFAHELDGLWTSDRQLPENAIAHDEASCTALLARVGLKIQEPVRYGSWSGRPSAVSYQDIIVASKVGA
jgi:SAM-dependent methyltransferase